MMLRPYRAEDEAELVDVWFQSWRSLDEDPALVTRDDLADRLPKDVADRWTCTVAEAEGRLVGFLAVCLAENRLDQLFILPDFQGRGLGRALFDVAVDQLQPGFWLKASVANRRARAFYERQGMRLERVEGSPGAGRAIYVSDPVPPPQGSL